MYIAQKILLSSENTTTKDSTKIEAFIILPYFMI
jgi:hypothetical protein